MFPSALLPPPSVCKDPCAESQPVESVPSEHPKTDDCLRNSDFLASNAF